MNPISLWLRVLIVGGIAAALWLAIASAIHAHDSRVHEEGVQAERSVWQAREKKRLEDEAAERARLDAQREESDRETRRLMELAQAGRAAADAAAGKLRNDLAAYVAAHRADPAAVGVGAPAGDPIGVLADVLGRADARAGILADYADRARIAGQQCERDYDALKTQRR